MTEYELADYTSSLMSNFLTVLTIYFSIITTYVIAAFVAGKRLTKIQLLIINGCFLTAGGIIGFLVVAIFGRFFAFASQNVNPEGSGTPVDFTWPLGILVSAMLVGSLVFMWSTRMK